MLCFVMCVMCNGFLLVPSYDNILATFEGPGWVDDAVRFQALAGFSEVSGEYGVVGIFDCPQATLSSMSTTVNQMLSEVEVFVICNSIRFTNSLQSSITGGSFFIIV